MVNIPVMDCADGRVRADTAVSRAPVAKIAAYTVLASDSGNLFTNRAAAGSVTFTLPAVAAGLRYRFAKAVNNQNIVVTGAASTMQGLTLGATATNSTTEYGVMNIECDGTVWIITYQTGTWTIS